MPLTTGRFSGPSAAPRDADHLLFVGRLIERKGAEFAIRAVAALRERGRVARLTLVGDGSERPALEALVRELRLDDAVTLAGALSHDEVAAHYRRATLLLMPAVTDWKGEQEGFGMVLVEAMASGLPIVATRSGGIVDVVRDGETGLLVEERNVAGLAAAAERLLADPALAARLAGAAGKDLQSRFAPSALSKGFEAVYQRATRAA